jgi:hypothetical protein
MANFKENQGRRQGKDCQGRNRGVRGSADAPGSPRPVRSADIAVVDAGRLQRVGELHPVTRHKCRRPVLRLELHVGAKQLAAIAPHLAEPDATRLV